jgi:esterase/lipase superfamily enzyme
MGRDVHLWSFGWWGQPVLVFPTAAGFAHEWQKEGMVEVLAPLLAAGKIKLFCPESNVSEAWTRKEADPAWRMQRHAVYERFIAETLVPYIRQDVRNPEARIWATGCSLGAMYAALAAFKQPEVFSEALCMSGRYLATVFTGGFMNSDVYLNSPLHFVPNLKGPALERLARKTHFTMVCGQGAYEEGCIEETIELAGLMEQKGIPCTRDIWGKDVAHHWTWWKRQAVYHFHRLLS